VDSISFVVIEMRQNNPPSVLAATQAPTVDVRNAAGELVWKIDGARAKELIDRGWASPVGAYEMKYLKLHEDAPWKPYAKAWSGGSRTTRRVRAEGRNGPYRPGQALGWDRNVEHKKVYD